jgi:hypothetical protein
MFALLGALCTPLLAASGEWEQLAEGLDLGRFTDDVGTIVVLRIDPERYETVALAASAGDGRSRTAQQWGREHGLVAVINAGMYAQDHATHTGYFHVGDHVNNGRWNQNDYRQAACFEPRREGLPRFVLMDLDTHPEETFADDYDVVVQNLRLIKKPGENRWPPRDRRWSEACLGEDGAGRMLWIFSRAPHAMHAWNERLLALPIDLVAAQHLEGGPEAQLWIAPAGVETMGSYETGFLEDESNLAAWPVPNVLGIRKRPAAGSGPAG